MDAAKIMTIIGIVVPTIGYFVAFGGFVVQGQPWNGGLWLFYALANICLMKLNGIF